MKTFTKAQFKKAHLNLVQWALTKDLQVEVAYQGTVDLEKSSSFKAIKEAIEASDEITIRLYDGDKKVGVAYYVDNGDNATIADHTDNELLNDWWHDWFNVYG